MNKPEKFGKIPKISPNPLNFSEISWKIPQKTLKFSRRAPRAGRGSSGSKLRRGIFLNFFLSEDILSIPPWTCLEDRVFIKPYYTAYTSMPVYVKMTIFTKMTLWGLYRHTGIKRCMLILYFFLLQLTPIL